MRVDQRRFGTEEERECSRNRREEESGNRRKSGSRMLCRPRAVSFARIVPSITELLKRLWAILSSRRKMECHHFAFYLPHRSSFRPRTSPCSLVVAALARQMDELVPEKRRNLNFIARRRFLDYRFCKKNLKPIVSPNISFSKQSLVQF